MDYIFSKLQRLWRIRWRADEFRVEHLSRIWYVAALRQSQKFAEQIKRNIRKFLRNYILFLRRCFNDISCGTRDNEQQSLANARLVSLYVRKFGKGQWSFIGSGSEKKRYSMKGDSPQGICDKLAEKMLIEFAESGCPIFRATTLVQRFTQKQRTW